MQLTRRDFTKFGALGLAARFAPALNAQNPTRKTRYAIIGIGRIAYHFMAGIQNTTNSSVTALVSGHRDKADKVAAQYGVPAGSIYSYENFDEIARNPNIDAVYVALPNSMHAEYTIRAAKAGKHVVCEKPMSTSVADAEAMIAACKSANVKLMIAYRCHYEPVHLKAIQMIRDGKDYWENVESYIVHNTNSKFTHGFCPTCLEKRVQELDVGPGVAARGRAP